MIGRELEREAGGLVVFRDHDPVVGLQGQRKPKKLGIEGRQPGRQGAVDDTMVPTSDHSDIVSQTGWVAGAVAGCEASRCRRMEG